MSTNHRTYLVVPFERMGGTISARQALIFGAAAQARFLASQLAAKVPGVALLQRDIDPETGDDKDTLLAEFGAVPPRFPDDGGWTLRLN